MLEKCPQCESPWSTLADRQQCPDCGYRGAIVETLALSTRVLPEHDDATLDQVGSSPTSIDEIRQLEVILEKFNAQWKHGVTPAVETFLEDGGRYRSELLLELVRSDLEHRLKTEGETRVESYLNRYRELEKDREAVIELLLAEFRARTSLGQDVPLSEFEQRFPEVYQQFIQALEAQQPRRRHIPVCVNCPSCNSSLAVSGSHRQPSIQCPTCGDRFRIDSVASGLPRIAKFELIAAVGRGAFGTVYKAHDTELTRIVAIKVPRSGTFSSEQEENNFVSEARHVAQLNHRGIVQVFEAGRTDDFPFIVSEFIEGTTMSAALRKRRYSFQEAADLMAAISDALQHAHERGVIHRDLKPSNVMLADDGSPRVMDFGLARLSAIEVTLGTDGSILGTPAYMSPEQAGGESGTADARSDVYSLGVMLFEILTQAKPFQGSTAMVLHQVVNKEPPDPRELNDRIPRDLVTICLKCLEKERERRYQTAADLRDELQRFLNHEPIQARPLNPVERGWRWSRRNAVLAGSLATIFVILSVSLSLVSWSWWNESIARTKSDRLATANAVLYQQEQQARQLAETRRTEAVTRFRQAQRAVDLWLTEFSDVFEFVPGIEEERLRILQQAVVDYEQFASSESADSELELERARTLIRVARVRRMLGQDREALSSLQMSRNILTGLTPATQTEYRLERARVSVRIALAHQALGEHGHASNEFAEAVRELENLLEQQPHDTEVQVALATALANRSRFLREQRQGENAQESAVRSVSLFESVLQVDDSPAHHVGLAQSLSILAGVEADEDAYAACLTSLDRAAQILNQVLDVKPDHLEYFHLRASLRMLQLPILQRMGRRNQARRVQQEIQNDFQILATRRYVPLYRLAFAQAQINLANVEYLQGQTAEAEQQLLQLSDLALLQQTTPSDDVEATLADARALLGLVYFERDQAKDAQLELELAVATYEALHAHEQSPERFQHRLALALSNLARVQFLTESAEVGINSFRRSVALLQELSETAKPRYRNDLTLVQQRFGEALWRASHEEQARPHLENAAFAWNQEPDSGWNGEFLHAGARFFLLCPDLAVRDVDQASHLAQLVCKLAPGNSEFHETQAAAACRKENWQDCLDGLDMVRREMGDLSAFGELFRAIALEKIGESAQAQQALAEGERKLAETRPGNPDYSELRAEAAAIVQQN